VSPSTLRAVGLGLDLGGRGVLDGIDVTVRSGEPLAVSGPSGSGKTVLLLALAGLLPATRGTVLMDDEPIPTDDPTWRAAVGVILQNQGLVPELTAEENVALPLRERRLGLSELATRSSEALSAVGLATLGDRLAGEMSGGQRQRVGVARALAGGPHILMADEPTAELDPDNRSLILGLLLASSPPRIVVVASNDPEVTDACARVVHLRDGRLDDRR
jgi:putative ABC transport system ATP-binding protein